MEDFDSSVVESSEKSNEARHPRKKLHSIWKMQSFYRNSKVNTINILLNSNASSSIVRKDVLYEHHKNLKDKKNIWSTMAGTFNTTLVTKTILKLPESNHSPEIYAKCHLTNKLSNYDLILGRDILHELGIIFNFENKTIAWEDVSISVEPPNCTAKEFFVIKEIRPVRHATKRGELNKF